MRLTLSVAVLAAFALRTVLNAQQAGNAEIRSILDEASALLLKVPLAEHAVTAHNIAAQQARAGDLDGALAPASAGANSAATLGGIAYELAKQGQLSKALALLDPTPRGQEKAVAYWQVVRGLLRASRYQDAVTVARLMGTDPTETEPVCAGVYGDPHRAMESGAKASGSIVFGGGARRS